MADEFIKVRGARTNNLKNINVDIPKDKLTVITGLSGSGKSSLAFDTIYAEGQRRYVESLSAYARQFLGLMEKPDVDLIEGLQPAISIDQKSTGHNPRSTVGTVTEIYDYLRLLFARLGHPRSPVTGRRLQKQTVQQIVDRILDYSDIIGEEVKLMILSPVIKNRKGTYEELFTRFLSQGFVRIRVDGHMYNLEEDIKLDRFVKHNIDLVIDRLVIKNDSKDDEAFVKRLTDSVELAINNGDGELLVNIVDESQRAKLGDIKLTANGDIFYSEKLVDPETGESFPEIEPHSFSFNSPHGACKTCIGLGSIKEIDQSLIYNPRLTIMEGGIYPWTRVIENESSYTMNLIQAVAEDKGIDLRKPIGELSEEHFNIVMFGTGSKKYAVNYTNSNGETNRWNSKFEGVIPNLMRRYEETDSDYIRKEIEQYMIEKECPTCLGYRLKKESLSVTIAGSNIVDVTNMSINDAFDWISSLADESKKLDRKEESILQKIFEFKEISSEDDMPTAQEREIGTQIFKEISMRLNFLISVGLDYLTLSRTARTLSGGEAQRIRLASQIGTGLTGVLYVLDEPSIGLHQKDNEKLIKTLENLRDIGNTVVVVEHDEDTINQADYVVDIGPGAGEHGGAVVAVGSTDNIKAVSESITGQYLSGKKTIDKEEIYEEIEKLDSLGEIKPKNNKNSLKLTNLTHNNLKGFDLEIPLGKMVCVTGVSGSGKSSTINDILYPVLSKHIYGSKTVPGAYGSVQGLEHIDKVIDIDQSPIGKTPRSNPATYTGVFTQIRELFAGTKEARARGYKAGRFSFNVKGGRCEKCQGAGVIQISMQFLPDVYVTCDECHGHRYNRETLQIDYKGKNISDVLNMTVEEGAIFFENISSIATKLKTLLDVGLGYIRLGQAATTLSGGESQRVKLASELAKRSTGKTMFILDEPTTGLHFEDVRKLLIVLHGLVAKGNSVVVIEHNLDVIKTADWIIDLGPEGGEKGGTIVAMGTPDDVANTEGSYTGEWLKRLMI
ncbi:excinuclease ABC subunit UvrA [Candidatus Dojkabacteria bacterium]|uniref:UvrABC system protein A n=1 Tax=Candidatus Dojkabacteria bacterium TaxID=2099670 RepID=A0A955LB25_9BACT|nr:excinuclease ABC subunit UvrA [Candidatus Dojkabacteria bacterium]